MLKLSIGASILAAAFLQILQLQAMKHLNHTHMTA